MPSSPELVIVEAKFRVPSSHEVKDQAVGFYQETGWSVIEGPPDTDHIDVYPMMVPHDTEESNVRALRYQLVKDTRILEAFYSHTEPNPTRHAIGFRLVHAFHLMACVITLPSENEVEQVYDRGGEIMRRHAHDPPGLLLSGEYGFTFMDPFGFKQEVASRTNHGG